MLVVSGCSFIDNDTMPGVLTQYATDHGRNICNLSRGGAGNFYIGQSVLTTIGRASGVFILWSGLHRIDIALPKQLHAQLKDCNVTDVGNDLWFHCGGILGNWHTHSATPSWLQQFFKQQYHSLDYEYLNGRSLTAIASCLAFLEYLAVPYCFGFVYDIHQDYTLQQHSLSSAVDVNHAMYKAIPWHKCLPSTPYEHCVERGLLSQDQFHPSAVGYQSWWQSVQPQVSKHLYG